MRKQLRKRPPRVVVSMISASCDGLVYVPETNLELRLPWQAQSRGGSQQQVNNANNALYASQPSQLYTSAAGDTTHRSLYSSFPSAPFIGSGLALPPSVLGTQVSRFLASFCFCRVFLPCASLQCL